MDFENNPYAEVEERMEKDAEAVVADDVAVIEDLAEPAVEQEAIVEADQNLAPEMVESESFVDEDYLEPETEDSLTFSNGVIEKIVAIAVREVPGVLGLKGNWFSRIHDTLSSSISGHGVTVEVTPDSAVRINVAVLIEYGAYAPKIFEDVKRAIVKQIAAMTGLEVAGVNLRIEDVVTPEEYEVAASSQDGAKDSE